MQEIAGIIAGAVVGLAFFPYIVSILSGKTKPNRVSWIFWAIIGFLDLEAYYSLGARETIWIPLIYFLCPLIVAILSLFDKYGKAGSTKADPWCFVGAVIGLVLWQLFNSPLVGLIAFLAVDIFVMTPTVIKSYVRPWEEDKLAWSLAFLGNGINLFAVSIWNFEIGLLPVYYVFQTGTISLLLWLSPRSR